MKRDRIRARGLRDTHALVQMVREQVGVMMQSMGRVAGSVDKLRDDVNRLHVHVATLGGMMTTLAESVDDHEGRLQDLEAKADRP